MSFCHNFPSSLEQYLIKLMDEINWTDRVNKLITLCSTASTQNDITMVHTQVLTESCHEIPSGTISKTVQLAFVYHEPMPKEWSWNFYTICFACFPFTRSHVAFLSALFYHPLGQPLFEWLIIICFYYYDGQINERQKAIATISSFDLNFTDYGFQNDHLTLDSSSSNILNNSGPSSSKTSSLDAEP